MVQNSSPLQLFYKRLLKGRMDGKGLPTSEAYFISVALKERTGEYYSPIHVWVSLWLEGFVNPDEIDVIPEFYLEKYMGDVQPDMRELKKRLWIKHKSYLLKEFAIDLPF